MTRIEGAGPRTTPTETDGTAKRRSESDERREARRVI